MLRILISEPHEDVRQLLVRMVSRLGHEPVLMTVPAPEQLTSADILLVEPASPVSAVLAQAASIAVPALGLICASVSAPPAELTELGVEFDAFLVKPFTIDQLDGAIKQALRSRRRGPRPLGFDSQDVA
jgi:CheY-like chemotaxis protein